MSMGLSRSGAGLTQGVFGCCDTEVLRLRLVSGDFNAGVAEHHRSMAIVFAVAFRVSMNRRATGER